MTMIKVEHLKKSFGKKEVLKDISANVEKGKVISIIGPSGSGKSTFLRCLNVLETPTSGKIIFDGQDLTHISEKELDILREKMGMVFQSFNLFPNMNVVENVKLAPMKVKGVSEEEAEKQALELLDKVGLKDRAKQYPSSLSGGQQQRVAIARALAVEPEVLLMDEPTSALDPISTGKIEELTCELKKKYTIVIVTHNMQQALRISDKTAFFLLGDLIEMDTTDNIFTKPKDKRCEDYVTGRFG